MSAGAITIEPSGKRGQRAGTSGKSDEQISDTGNPLAETGSKAGAGAAKAEKAAENGPSIVIDGNATGTGSGAGSGTEFELPKRRGRPPGSGNRKARAPKPEALSVDAVEFSLASIHLLLATILQKPELDLSKNETKELAKAITNVQSHYPVAVNPKFAAWAHLVSVAGIIYGPRVATAFKASKKDRAQKSREAQAKPQQQPEEKRPAPPTGEGMSPSQLYGPLAGRG